MNIFFRLLLTLNATSLLIIVFLIQKKISPDAFLVDFLRFEIPNFVWFFFYMAIPLLLTGITIWMARFLGEDEIKSGGVTSIEHANNSFLPSYLGYFFVALSISDVETLYFIYGILFVFTFLSQALYFNPLFLLYGYEFYNIRTTNGAAIFLISKEKYKTPAQVGVVHAARINGYTFIDLD